MHRYFAPCKGIQDSLGFWTSCRGFQIPGTEFRILCQWNLDSGFLELYSGFQSPGFRIPQTKFSRIPIQNCPMQGYLGSGIREI